MKGFFSSIHNLSLKRKTGLLAKCGKCGQKRGCDFPKVKPYGNFKRKILIVMPSPGNVESDLMGLCGKRGRLLKKAFIAAGADVWEDALVTSAMICEPEETEDLNRRNADHCIPNLLGLIKEREPRVIIPVGSLATHTIIKHFWGETAGKYLRWVGYAVPDIALNTWICPVQDLELVRDFRNEMMEVYFRKYIQQAIEKSEARPWGKRPDYKKQLRIIIDPNQAASVIRAHTDLLEYTGSAALDFETNRIKPDASNARIHSMSICFNGVETVAFPWIEPAISAAADFLKSPIPKYAHNMKFEDRWTRAILGFPVRNFVWDSMLMAHLLDNRVGTTGLKFLSYAVLGVPSYDNDIKQYLRSDNAEGVNRVGEIPLQKLLTYNALDSALTFALAEIQKKKMKGYPEYENDNREI